jgi:hypothetical protein
VQYQAKLEKKLPIAPNSKSYFFTPKAHKKQNLTINFVEKFRLCVLFRFEMRAFVVIYFEMRALTCPCW